MTTIQDRARGKARAARRAFVLGALALAAGGWGAPAAYSKGKGGDRAGPDDGPDTRRLNGLVPKGPGVGMLPRDAFSRLTLAQLKGMKPRGHIRDYATVFTKDLGRVKLWVQGFTWAMSFWLVRAGVADGDNLARVQRLVNDMARLRSAFDRRGRLRQEQYEVGKGLSNAQREHDRLTRELKTASGEDRKFMLHARKRLRIKHAHLMRIKEMLDVWSDDPWEGTLHSPGPAP